jgi:hypothetical protein
MKLFPALSFLLFSGAQNAPSFTSFCMYIHKKICIYSIQTQYVDLHIPLMLIILYAWLRPSFPLDSRGFSR